LGGKKRWHGGRKTMNMLDGTIGKKSWGGGRIVGRQIEMKKKVTLGGTGGAMLRKKRKKNGGMSWIFFH